MRRADDSSRGAVSYRVLLRRWRAGAGVFRLPNIVTAIRTLLYLGRDKTSELEEDGEAGLDVLRRFLRARIRHVVCGSGSRTSSRT